MTHDMEPGDSAAARVHVFSPDGARIPLASRTRLTFGRGDGSDIVIALGRDLSRQAGEIAADARGAIVINRSRAHALFVDGDSGYHVRLPRADDHGPSGGWLVTRGTAIVGSTAMMRNGMVLHIVIAEQQRLPPHELLHHPSYLTDTNRNGTVRPLTLRPDTKLFLVALLLCRPWLLDPRHATALPTSPQIAREALEFVSASHQLGRFDSDTGFRGRLVEQVNDHLKYLRERVLASGLIPGGTRLTPAVTAEVLLANDIVTRADLAIAEKPEWRSRQEDLWWVTR